MEDDVRSVLLFIVGLVYARRANVGGHACDISTIYPSLFPQQIMYINRTPQVVFRSTDGVPLIETPCFLLNSLMEMKLFRTVTDIPNGNLTLSWPGSVLTEPKSHLLLVAIGPTFAVFT